MYKIAVLDYRLLPNIKAQIQALASNKIDFPKERCPENEWITRTSDADIALVTVWGKVDKEYLDACPKLKYVGLCGTSTANIDLEELNKRGIAFSNIVSTDKESVAEYFFMQLVSLARGVGKYQWKANEEHELKDRHIGIIGLGQVGKAMAHMALAYKMKVAYYSPHRKQEWEDRGLEYLSMNDLMSLSEIVVVCSPTNVKVLGETEFRLMRSGSVLVQACSGSPFEESAFMNWVSKDGNYALFDMSAGESNYQLYKDLPRVMFSKDVAGDTYESDQRRGKRVIENLTNFLNIDKSTQEHKVSIVNLVKDLFTYIDVARSMTDYDRSQNGDYKNNPDLRYPQTRSEYIADKISTLLASSDWVNGEDEPILDEMLGLAGQLDINVNQPDVWNDLFKLADELKKANEI